MLGAREPSQGGTRPCMVPALEPSQDTRHVPRGLAWCPPVSQAKTRDACHGALLGAREPSQGGTRPCMVPAREPSQGATGPCLVPASQAKTRDACHVALLGAHEPSQDTRRVPCGLAWCPRAEPRHMTRATSRATEATMTLDMVLEAVLGHVTHAMMRATARGTTCLACHDAHAMVPRHL